MGKVGAVLLGIPPSNHVQNLPYIYPEFFCHPVSPADPALSLIQPLPFKHTCYQQVPAFRPAVRPAISQIYVLRPAIRTCP